MISLITLYCNEKEQEPRKQGVDRDTRWTRGTCLVLRGCLLHEGVGLGTVVVGVRSNENSSVNSSIDETKSLGNRGTETVQRKGVRKNREVL